MKPVVEYDDENEILIINGLEYSYDFFDFLNADNIKKAKHEGYEYRLVSKDGALTIEQNEL